MTDDFSSSDQNRGKYGYNRTGAIQKNVEMDVKIHSQMADNLKVWGKLVKYCTQGNDANSPAVLVPAGIELRYWRYSDRIIITVPCKGDAKHKIEDYDLKFILSRPEFCLVPTCHVKRMYVGRMTDEIQEIKPDRNVYDLREFLIEYLNIKVQLR